jgi:cell wall-associated NlpC family hydrolase
VKTLIEYAKSFIGKPYIWGAEGPTGFDCSGLVQEILRSVGEDPKDDQTAQALYNYFSQHNMTAPTAGALVFYGKSIKEITHVAFSIDNFRVIEAGGGGSKCINTAMADHFKGMVRMRPYNHRADQVAIVLPDYINCNKE